MNTLLPALVIGGDRMSTGRVDIGPSGLTRQRELLPWATVRRVGAQETQTDMRPIRGLGAAAVVGYAASVFAGPLGIATAAAVGGIAAGLRTRETFEVWFDDGSHVTVRTASGVLAKARDWHAAARAAVETQAAMLSPPKQGLLSRLRR